MIPILVPLGIYKLNYIDDFLVKECQLRIRESKDGDFVAKKNYKKCLRTIRGEWSNLVSSICIDMKKYAAYMSRSNSYGPTEEEKEIFHNTPRRPNWKEDKWSEAVAHQRGGIRLLLDHIGINGLDQKNITA